MDRTKAIKVCETIAEDMKSDASNFDGKPFNGRNVAEYFGNQGAAIAGLSRILKTLIEGSWDLDGVPVLKNGESGSEMPSAHRVETMAQWKEKTLEALVNELNQCHATILKCTSVAGGSVVAGLAPHMEEVARQIVALAEDRPKMTEALFSYRLLSFPHIVLFN